jgi:hypothetical protein
LGNPTTEELDKMPNFLSGLPTNPGARKEALEAYDEGGPRGLNEWRMARWKEMHRSAPVRRLASSPEWLKNFE